MEVPNGHESIFLVREISHTADYSRLRGFQSAESVSSSLSPIVMFDELLLSEALLHVFTVGLMLSGIAASLCLMDAVRHGCVRTHGSTQDATQSSEPDGLFRQ